VRIGQLDPGQYASSQEYRTWAYSTCSTAAMTEVANYYGGHYRITDLLVVEFSIGAITPEQGLLEDAGIAWTMAHFGFVTSWGYGWTLDQVVELANQGTPVIVAFPPSRYPGGHLLVVTGGDGSQVLVADSSGSALRGTARRRGANAARGQSARRTSVGAPGRANACLAGSSVAVAVCRGHGRRVLSQTGLALAWWVGIADPLATRGAPAESRVVSLPRALDLGSVGACWANSRGGLCLGMCAGPASGGSGFGGGVLLSERACAQRVEDGCRV
jgi:hypothetical protein